MRMVVRTQTLWLEMGMGWDGSTHRLGFLRRRRNIHFCSTKEGIEAPASGCVCWSLGPEIPGDLNDLSMGDGVIEIQGLGEGEVIPRGCREGLDGGENGRGGDEEDHDV